MKHSGTNSKGVLLWVDDCFVDAEWAKKDVVEWSRVFGAHSDRVFSLMNLDLRIAVTFDDAKSKLEELRSIEEVGTYVFCVVDLSLPKNLETLEEDRSDLGACIAKLALEAGFNVAVLSSQSGGENVLATNGVTGVPFYQKAIGEARRMPDALVRRILMAFRANIHWISIERIVERIAPPEESSLEIQQTVAERGLSGRFFPFFGIFQDFVEHWEYRPRLRLGAKVVSRCSRTLSDACIQQCLLVTQNEFTLSQKGQVVFRYFACGKKTTAVDVREFLKGGGAKNSVMAVRILPEHLSPDEFEEIVGGLDRREDRIIFFLLTDDDTSDPYLAEVADNKEFLFEDFPCLQWGDSHTREFLIRSALDLNIQNLWESKKGEDRPGDIYLLFPELLIHPLSWVVLLESKAVSDTISDPPEILFEVEQSLKKFQESEDGGIVDRLIEGKPLKPDQLLRVGEESLQLDPEADYEKKKRKRWLPSAIHFWLSSSWQFPYGCNHQLGTGLRRRGGGEWEAPEGWEEWEVFSLDMLRSLLAEADRDGVTFKDQESYAASLAAVEFIGSPAIRKLLDSEEVSEDEWTDLLQYRWPHHKYPIPAALNRKLKEKGKYLWVDMDSLNLSTSFPATRAMYERLHAQVALMTRLIENAENNLPHLPIEWRGIVRDFVDWSRQSAVGTIWGGREEESRRAILQKRLLQVLDNMLPVTYAARVLMTRGVHPENAREILGVLRKIDGSGTVMGKLGELRAKHPVPWLGRANESASSGFGDYKDLQCFSRLARNLQSSNGTSIGEDFWGHLGNFSGTMANSFIDSDEKEKGAPYEALLHTLSENREDWFKFLGDDPAISKLRSKFGVGISQCLTTPADIFSHTLEALSHFSFRMIDIFKFDEYHFYNLIRWVRNDAKGSVDADIGKEEIERIFEYFFLGFDSILDQLQFVLRLLNRDDLAGNIQLATRAPKIPDSKLEQKLLNEFVALEENGDGYYLHHLGLPNETLKGKLAVALDDGTKKLYGKSS